MSFFKRLSLRGKLVTIIVSTTSLVSVVALLSIAFFSINSQKEEMIHNGTLQSKLISQYVKVALDFNDTTWAAHVVKKLEEIPSVTECHIYRHDGTIFTKYSKTKSTSNNNISPTIPNATFVDDYLFIRTDIVEENKTIGTVLLTISTEPLNRSISSFVVFLLILLCVISLLGFIIATFMQKVISTPIINLAQSAHLISKTSSLELDITYSGEDEIGTLYCEFFGMLATLKKRGQELKNAQAFLDSVIDSMPSILIGVDREINITLMNKMAEIQLGKKREEQYGKRLNMVWEEYSEIADKISETITTKQVFSQLRNSNGNERTHRVTIYPLHQNSDKGAVIRLDDITRETKLSQELAQSRKMDAIGQLAGGVAHDFNNMLGGIMGAAELLQEKLSNSNDETADLINLILDASEKAASLTKKLLAFGRKGSIVSTAIDMHPILNDSVTILQRTVDKKVEISFAKGATETSVVGDNSALQNVIINLGINAGHAMPDGGRIQIETRNTELSPAYCNASPFSLEPGNFLEIEIRDTGTGIAPQNLKKIFEPFFTTKDSGKGTGLGLAAAYGTIKDHRGAIVVYSEVGIGTVFHIYLPISANKAAAVNRKDVSIQTGTGTILLVDDEDIIRISGKYLLEKLGYTVLLADNGVAALTVYNNHKQDIDLVISDMIMPKMGGSETFYKIRALNPQCPVIISSGFTKDESLHQLKQDGLAGFLDKPFRMHELSTLLARVLKKEKK